MCVVFCSNSICLLLKGRSSVRSYQPSSDCELWLIQEAPIWHIWGPSMWPWMLTSADSTPPSSTHCCCGHSALKRLSPVKEICVCACRKRQTCWILSFCTELLQNYCSIWCYIVNKNHSVNVWYAELAESCSSMDCVCALIRWDSVHQTWFIQHFL